MDTVGFLGIKAKGGDGVDQLDKEMLAQQSDEHNANPGTQQSEKKLKLNVLWTFVFLAIAALTIFAIVSQKDFSLKSFISFFTSLHPVWIAASVMAMLGFIIFEALAIRTMLKSFGYKPSLGNNFIYSSSDIYFSAITPSSTGGQPASAYFIMKDGIPGTVTAISLMANLVMYSFSIIILGIVSVILKPSVFFHFPTACKVLIVIGAVSLTCLGVIFILLIYKSAILKKLGNIALTFLAKIHLIRKLDKKKAKLEALIKSYDGQVEHFKEHKKPAMLTLLFNVLQRFSLILVTVFTFLASGGDPRLCVEVGVSQCMVILGTNILPIPGAMGISDYMLICAFGAIGFSDAAAVNLNLVSRGISFYTCVIICGLSLIVKIISGNVALAIQKRKITKNEEVEK